MKTETVYTLPMLNHAFKSHQTHGAERFGGFFVRQFWGLPVRVSAARHFGSPKFFRGLPTY